MVKTLVNSQHTMQEKVERVIVIAKHSDQDGYKPLLKAIPSVIFVKPDKDFDEQNLLTILECNPGGKRQPTAILIDDVCHFI